MAMYPQLDRGLTFASRPDIIHWLFPFLVPCPNPSPLRSPSPQATLTLSLPCTTPLSHTLGLTQSSLPSWPSLTRCYFHCPTVPSPSSPEGGVLACEQLLMPRHSSTVPRAFIDLLIQVSVFRIQFSSFCIGIYLPATQSAWKRILPTPT